MELQELNPVLKNTLFKLKLAIQVKEIAEQYPKNLFCRCIVQAYNSKKVTDTKILQTVKESAEDNPEVMKEIFGEQIINNILELLKQCR